MRSLIVTTAILLTLLCLTTCKKCADPKKYSSRTIKRFDLYEEILVHTKLPQVCGSDEITYYSPEHIEDLNCWTGESVTVLHEGPCQSYCGYVRNITNPICGTNGKTYRNVDVLRRENCVNKFILKFDEPHPKIAYRGECKTECPFSSEWDPVCGSDGYEYSNLEALDAYNCVYELIGHRQIHVVQDRDSCQRCPQVFPGKVSPLCGSDGKTYFAQEAIDYYNCMDDLKGLNKVVPLFEGFCDSDCPVLSKEWSPVCSIDGKTYENGLVLMHKECMKHSGVRLDLNYAYSLVAHPGTCEKPCPTISRHVKPLCGTDGKTYENESALANRNCLDSIYGEHDAIEVLHAGVCRTLNISRNEIHG